MAPRPIFRVRFSQNRGEGDVNKDILPDEKKELKRAKRSRKGKKSFPLFPDPGRKGGREKGGGPHGRIVKIRKRDVRDGRGKK